MATARIDDGSAALRLIDEIVVTLHRRGVLPYQDMEGIAAALAAEADKAKNSERGRIAKMAQKRALRWLVWPEHEPLIRKGES